ncbi:hypothetical protein [Pyrobaculum calidifontis]|uniref:Uncharacterized protein n=1 Tax=Pyrobaculum calidifontis (strain DSM 21063 / JCM 11548 / VA1) TaxID=410359 RepID=A3MTE4_PYRCJ|nr:hypothetical protein [Pyrobaculum calidifontis]ABO07911.1 hypothetical protein Pcal_0480 [Pyrobaculum calidifontis JCM 11548]
MPSPLVLHRLLAVRSLALRRGVWFRVRPAARALIDAVIIHLRRGGRVKSPALIDALKRAVEEALSLAAPLRVKAKALGYAIAAKLGITVDEERAIALGIQWINTPKRYRGEMLLTWTVAP